VNYVLKTGCQWEALPSEYPGYKSVHRYFMIWSKVPKKGKSVLRRALKKNGFRRSNQGGAVIYDHLFDS
jgi:transposase